MKLVILAAIFLVTVIYFMLKISFESFSRIALARFMEDLDKEKVKGFDFVKNYDTVLNALSGFSFFWQLCLFIYSFILLAGVLASPIQRAVLLIFSFLLVFSFALYTLAFANKEKILKTLIPLYSLAWFFFWPFNKAFSFFTQKYPEEKESDQEDLSEKELEVFLEEGTKDGVLEEEDQELIESIIEFGDTLVKEIMTPRVDMIYVKINASLEELVRTINEKKKSRYPVISGRIDHIEGIILSKDVLDYWQENQDGFNIKKILRPPFFVPDTMRILELLKELQKSKKKFAIVVDEFGGISGVVTMEDIIEEIVGEIHDEYDEDTEQIVKEKDHFLVKGDTDIEELNDTLQLNLEEDEDYQTVAGLISFKLGKIPDESDEITIDGYSFEVVETEKNRIKKVKISRTESESQAQGED